MEILDNPKCKSLLDLIEQGAHEAALELLKGDSLISKDELNESLMSACQHGNKCLVQMLIGRGADVNYRDTNGNTPLLISAQNGFTDIVQFLLTNKADVNASNSVGDSALILSIGSSRPRKITENLLKQTEINIDHQNQDGYTAIMKAVEVKDIDILKILLDVEHAKRLASFNETFDKYKLFDQLPDYVLDGLSKRKVCAMMMLPSLKTLDETVNCKGANVHQIAERCGIGNVFQLLQEHVHTKISPLELAMRENDVKSFQIFLDCEFIYANKKKYLNEALKHIFQRISEKEIGDFSDKEIAMIKTLLEHGVDVNTTWLDRTRVLDHSLTVYREQAESDRYDRLSSSLRITGSVRQIKPILIAAQIGHLKVIELLLSFKAEINRYTFPDSPLHIALSHGHTECANLLLQNGAVINVDQALLLAVDQQNPQYVRFLVENCKIDIKNPNSVFYIDNIFLRSVRKGNLDIIGLLLDLGAGVNGARDSNSCPLAESKNGEVAKFLIKSGANLKYVRGLRLEKCISPLIRVLPKRDCTDNSVVEVIQVLLENGASVIDKCGDGKTPLMLAAEKERSMNVLQLFLDHGAELGEVDDKGYTALILAARRGCSQNVSFLLQAVKDNKEVLNLQNSEGSTALMYAAVIRNPNIITDLINHGADVNVKDRQGNTALMFAARLKNPVMITELINHGADVNVKDRMGNTSMNVLQLFLDHGAELGEVDGEGNTALILAARADCSQNVSFLLKAIGKRKELLNLQNFDGLTALMAAAKLKNQVIIADLINQGADVNIKDREGNTALLHLLRSVDGSKSEDQIIKSLIQAGSEVNWQNIDGLSPLMMAAQKYLKDVMCILLDSGAEINAVSKTDATKTALTHLEYIPHGQKYLSCLEFLLDKGASSSYLAGDVFHKMIFTGQIQIIPKLIMCGLGPVSCGKKDWLCSQLVDDIMLSQDRRFVSHPAFRMISYSPLCTALCDGNSALAHFFVGNLFLTHSDISLLGRNQSLRQYLKRKNYKECLGILNEMSTQPMSLFNLSFVAVSTAVGTSPGREIRVNQLPLPGPIKDRLLFKKQDVALAVPENDLSAVRMEMFTADVVRRSQKVSVFNSYSTTSSYYDGENEFQDYYEDYYEDNYERQPHNDYRNYHSYGMDSDSD